MDVVLTIPDDVVNRLGKQLDMTIAEIVVQAMDLYAWVVSEQHAGRHVLTSRSDGTEMKRLDQYTKEKIRK